jgi:two-component system NtrC family sensor kinase
MSTPTTDNKKVAVLYVDDEEQALKYFRKGLEKHFIVFTAPGVDQAMEILNKEATTIAAVITDQRMPGKSGVDLLTQVRSLWPAMVRILITAYTDIESAVAAVNAGAVYKYITKPADFPLLRQTLTEAVGIYRETLHRNAMEKTLRELEAQRQATLASESQREQLQQRLIAASREAGRAEVATGILHNVGNVLNSMNVSATVVTKTLEESRVDNLCKGLAIIEEHANDLASFITTDERGQRLPGYLAKLAPVLNEEHATIATAMTSLSRNIEHIGQIVRMQQAHVKDVEIQQPVNVAELMEDALRINQSSIEKRAVEIVREYAQLPTVLLDQHRVLQILINLVTNAVRATREDPNSRRRITLRIKEESTPESPQIVFQVADNGVGIAPENMTRIFTYGFTTHSDGHGFGLHSAANAAKEMGGDLTAASDGPGLGATFTLRLPIKREAAANKGDTPSLTPVNK